MDNSFNIFSLPDEVMVNIFTLSIDRDPTKLAHISKQFKRIFDENFAYKLFMDYSDQPHLKYLTDKINKNYQNTNYIQKVAILYTTLIGMTNEIKKGGKIKRESFEHYQNVIDPSRLEEIAKKLEEEIAREENLFFSALLGKIHGFKLLKDKELQELNEKFGSDEGAKEIVKLKKYHEWIDKHPEKLQTFEVIQISDPHIRRIPRKIIEFSSLQELTIIHSKIETIPPEIGQLQHLETLYLWDNRIKSIPPEIGKLKNLTSLNLSENQIEDIPPEIGELENLTILNLAENQIKNIPPEIGKLKALEELDLAENQIKNIPPEIGDLVKLSDLNLTDNQITDLPSEILKLENLHDFTISLNPLSEEAQNLVDKILLVESETEEEGEIEDRQP